MAGVPTKHDPLLVIEGETVSPTNKNRSILQLEKNIDDLRQYLSESPLHHFDYVDATPTSFTYAAGMVKDSSGNIVTISGGTVIIQQGVNCVQFQYSPMGNYRCRLYGHSSG